MIVLDSTDVIEGGASVTSVVEYTFHGLVGSVLTQLAAGVMDTTLTAALYTAADIVVVTSIILVNTHSAAVAVTLRLDPANAGNPRYIIPKTVSLGIGYSLHTDGVKITVMDANGAIVTTGSVSDTAYNATTWDGVTDIAPSKNAVRDKFESLTTIATDPIWAAAGDLVQGTGNDAAAVLSKGGALALLRMNSGATAVEWGTGGQIAFPATAVPSADPNTLDDYEEGTWTATGILATMGSAATSAMTAFYTKIGNLVTASCQLTFTKGTGTGVFSITTLPFTSGDAGYTAGCISPHQCGKAGYSVAVQLQTGSTTLLLVVAEAGTGAQASLTNAELGTTAILRISITYRI